MERRAAGDPHRALRDYYSDTDYFVSAEGILKVISVVTGIAAAAAHLGGGACAGAPWARAAGAAAAGAGAAVAGCLHAAVLCSLAAWAPRVFLYTDLMLSTALGVLLLVTAALGLASCGAAAVAEYLRVPLAAAHAAVVSGGAVVTYAAVSRRLDTRGAAPTTPAPPARTELEV